MKKFNILIIMLAAVLALTVMPSSAKESLCGELISIETFESWNFFAEFGRGDYTYDLENVHTGKRARFYDFTQAGAVGANFHLNPMRISDEYAYYGEVYIKSGNNSVLGDLEMYLHGDSQYSNRVFFKRASAEDDENGWRKHTAYGMPIDGQENVGMCLYMPGVPAGVNIVYMDDIRIYKAPYRISTNDITASALKPVNLRDMIVYAYNKSGEPEILNVGTNLANWEVVAGDANVDKNGNLVCTNPQGGTVTVKLSILGVSTKFNVEFSKGIKITEPKKYANGMTIMSINNQTEKEETFNVAVLLYDKNGRLYDVKYSTKTVASGVNAALIVPSINVPYNMTDYTKKIIITSAYETVGYTLK